jgi:hypothetical protein
MNQIPILGSGMPSPEKSTATIAADFPSSLTKTIDRDAAEVSARLLEWVRVVEQDSKTQTGQYLDQVDAGQSGE